MSHPLSLHQLLLFNACAISEKTNPRQRLIILLQLSSALTALERFQDVPQLLREALDVARLITDWEGLPRWASAA